MNKKVFSNIIFMLALTVYTAKAYSLSYEYIPCENPFLLHDIYYGSYDVYKGLSPREIYEIGGEVCVPTSEIKEQYELALKMEKLGGIGLYPSTYKDVYEKIQIVDSGLISEDSIASFYEKISEFLFIEGIKDLEELKHLAETQGDDLTKGSKLYFYKFPEEFFSKENRLDTVIKTYKYYDVHGSFFKAKDLSMISYYRTLPLENNDIEPLDEYPDKRNFTKKEAWNNRQYRFKDFYYFNYSIFKKCLEFKYRVGMCMEHNFILSSYFYKLLKDNTSQMTYVTNPSHGEIMGTQVSLGSVISNHIDVMVKEYEPKKEKELWQRLETGDLNWKAFVNKEDIRDHIYIDVLSSTEVALQGNKLLSELGMLTEKDFVDYLLPQSWKRGNKVPLSNKLQDVAVFGETEGNKLTRQDKLNYMYFRYFDNLRPDFIKKNEYDSVSKFYYGKEEVYKSLYDLMEEQKIAEQESPLFYSVLYHILLSRVQEEDAYEYKIFLESRDSKELTEGIQKNYEIVVGNTSYAKADLPKICKLYHESLDKALQGATEERRKAFEEKNIQVCEM